MMLEESWGNKTLHCNPFYQMGFISGLTEFDLLTDLFNNSNTIPYLIL
jgi:hypothetical protein